MDIQAINTAIISGNFNAMDLDSIADAIKFARTKVTRVLGVTLTAGTKVTATHSQLGGTVVGTVVKVKQKKALVKIEAGRQAGKTYDLPLSMLTVA